MIFIGIPFLNRVDLLEECVSRFDADCEVFVINNGEESVDNLVKFCSKNKFIKKFEICQERHNLGVSASWNKILRKGFRKKYTDVFIGSNDTFLSPTSLDKAKEILSSNKKALKINLCGNNFFIIRKELIEEIGWFDENFYPAYNEDQDFEYRMRLAGLGKQILFDIGVKAVHRGSQTIFSNMHYFRQNKHTHQLNIQYYIEKWGGIAGSETYDKPFNGEAFKKRDKSDLRWRPR